MLNFKFIKAQFKNVWIILLATIVILGIWIGVAAITNSFGLSQSIPFEQEPNPTPGLEPYRHWSRNIDGGSEGILQLIFFDFPFLISSFIFAIAMSFVLISRDVNRGYITSWLTTPMSRKTIFNSKLFVILTSTLLVNLWMIILEMLIYSWRMEDFNDVVGNLLMGNLALMIFSFFVASIIWFIFSGLPKPGIAIGISAGLIIWFILCKILVQLSAVPNLKDLKYFKYFTIHSLLNSPLKFTNLPSLEDHLSEVGPLDPTKAYTFQWNDRTQVLPIEVLDFAWQLPVMLIAAAGFFTGSQFIIKNKDFSF